MLDYLLRKMHKPKNAVEQAVIETFHTNGLPSDRLFQAMYYNTLYIPQTLVPDMPTGKMELPIFEQDGRTVIPVYTSVELLRSIKAPGAAGLSGLNLAEIWPDNCWMALNAKTPFEIWLRSDVIQSLPKVPWKTLNMMVEGRAAKLLSGAILLNDATKELLTDCLSQYPEITAAYHGELQVVKGKSHFLLIGLHCTTTDADNLLERMRDRLTRQLSRPAALVILDESSAQVKAFLEESVEPFYFVA